MQWKRNKSKTNKREHGLNAGAMNLCTSPPQKATQSLTVSNKRLNISEGIQRATKIIPRGKIMVCFLSILLQGLIQFLMARNKGASYKEIMKECR